MKLNVQKWFFPHDNKESHFKTLDGLRGLAVLIVMLSHSSNAGLMFHAHLNFQGSGKAGVYLFFLLSAYLLDRQIGITFLSGKNSIQYWLYYFWRRFLRIYPLFFAALSTYFILNFIGFYPTKIEEMSDILSHLLLLDGKNVFWSIPVEFKYYFISPLIIWLFYRYFNWNYLLVSLFVFTLALIALLFDSRFSLSNTSTLKYLPIFLAGTLISIYELLYGNSVKKVKNKLFDILGIVSVVIIFVSFPYYVSKLFTIDVQFHKPPFYLLYVLLWSLVLVSSKYSNGLVRSILSFKPLRFLGTISFSLYLFHMLIIPFVKRIDVIPSNLKIYAFFIVSIVLSSFTYLLIELPLSKIKIFRKKSVTKEVVPV